MLYLLNSPNYALSNANLPIWAIFLVLGLIAWVVFMLRGMHSGNKKLIRKAKESGKRFCFNQVGDRIGICFAPDFEAAFKSTLEAAPPGQKLLIRVEKTMLFSTNLVQMTKDQPGNRNDFDEFQLRLFEEMTDIPMKYRGFHETTKFEASLMALFFRYPKYIDAITFVLIRREVMIEEPRLFVASGNWGTQGEREKIEASLRLKAVLT